MQRYFDVVQTPTGNAVPGALVYVYVGGTTVLATLFSDNGVTAAPNPLTTNTDGEYAFYAANGTYTLSITAANYVTETKPGTVLFDPADNVSFGGNVGIGTSSPASPLQVIGAGRFGASVAQTTGAGAIYNDGNDVTIEAFAGNNTATKRNLLLATYGGNVGIGTSTTVGKVSASVVPDTTLNVYDGLSPNSYSGITYQSRSLSTAGTGWYHFVGQSGNGTAVTTNNILIFGNGNVQNTSGSYGAISDLKLKENVTDATPKLSDLLRVRIVNYNLKAQPDQKHIGVIAQELEQIFPSLIEEVSDRDVNGNDLGTTTKAVKYSVFVPMLIKAFQEQQDIIDDLRARVAVIEAK